MAGKRATLRLLVDGMSCGSCEARIEKALRALEGVHHVSASASLSEVNVSYDAGSVTREMMVSAISGAGYSVRPDSASTPAHALPARRRQDSGTAEVRLSVSVPRAHRSCGGHLPHHPLHRRLYIPPHRNAVHGLWPDLCRRASHLAALHRHVRGDRPVPGDQANRGRRRGRRPRSRAEPLPSNASGDRPG